MPSAMVWRILKQRGGAARHGRPRTGGVVGLMGAAAVRTLGYSVCAGG